MNTEELADPRLISTDDLVADMSSSISDVLINTREHVAGRLQLEYSDAPIAGVSNFDAIARSASNTAVSEGEIRRQVRPVCEDAIERTFDRMNSDVHSPKINESPGVRSGQTARYVAKNVEFETRNVAEDMLDRMREGVRHGAMRGEGIDTILSRVREEFNDGELENRSRLIAHMELQTAIQSTKLGAYERHEDVDGVRVITLCGATTTLLCRQLAGCDGGESAVAWFEDGDIGEQLSEQVSDDLLFEGFRPLPSVPPYHWGCKSSVAPAVRE